MTVGIILYCYQGGRKHSFGGNLRGTIFVHTQTPELVIRLTETPQNTNERVLKGRPMSEKL